MIKIFANREEIKVEGELLSFQEYFINNKKIFNKLKNIFFTYKNIITLDINDNHLSADLQDKDYNLYIKVYEDYITIMSLMGNEKDVPNLENLKEDLSSLFKIIRHV